MKIGDIFYCINRKETYSVLFEEDVLYEFICAEEIENDNGSGPYIHNYILDRVDNGKREIFYDVYEFEKYFITMKELRKLKLQEIDWNILYSNSIF